MPELPKETNEKKIKKAINDLINLIRDFECHTYLDCNMCPFGKKEANEFVDCGLSKIFYEINHLKYKESIKK